MYYQRWLYLAVVITCFGCNVSSSGAGKLPPSWPISGLSLPSGAQQVKLPDIQSNSPVGGDWYIDGTTSSPGTAYERREWKVAFQFNGSGQSLADHFDAQLKPLGYELWIAGTPPGQRRAYITQDRKQQVMVEFLDLPGFKGYQLQVILLANPRPDIAQTTPIP